MAFPLSTREDKKTENTHLFCNGSLRQYLRRYWRVGYLLSGVPLGGRWTGHHHFVVVVTGTELVSVEDGHELPQPDHAFVLAVVVKRRDLRAHEKYIYIYTEDKQPIDNSVVTRRGAQDSPSLVSCTLQQPSQILDKTPKSYVQCQHHQLLIPKLWVNHGICWLLQPVKEKSVQPVANLCPAFRTTPAQQRSAQMQNFALTKLGTG